MPQTWPSSTDLEKVMGTVLQLRTTDIEATPTPDNGKVNLPPRRQRNTDVRSREYLTPQEADALIAAAGKLGRYGHRDATMLMIAYRHGLRVGELVALRWDMVDLNAGHLHVRRLKNGTPSTHPLRGPGVRALRRVKREQAAGGSYVFTSERGGPMTASNVRKMVARAGVEAALPFTVHPHMLRHAAGFTLANAGHDTRSIQDYLGHRNIANTVIYTQLAAGRFNDFWKD
jgi:type 1 fimbriae regulatory protein FimE